MKQAATAKIFFWLSGNSSPFAPNHALWKDDHVAHSEHAVALLLAADISRRNLANASVLASSVPVASMALALHARLIGLTSGKSFRVAVDVEVAAN